MSKDLIGYDRLVESGLRTVIREALRRVAAEGWPGTHHAYVTFRTDAPGVDVPDSLRARYPDELTIVLQHQFWDLEVDDDRFAVTLSFSKVGHRLTVPFAALTAYADPSIQFGLQFGTRQEADDNASSPEADAAEPSEQEAVAEVAPAADGDDASPAAGGEKIVALDRFRKK